MGFLSRRVFGGVARAFSRFGSLFLLISFYFLHQGDTLLLCLCLANVEARRAAFDLRLIPNLVADVGLLIQAAIDKKLSVAGGLVVFEFDIGCVLAGNGVALNLLGLRHVVDLGGAALQILRGQRVVGDG